MTTYAAATAMSISGYGFAADIAADTFAASAAGSAAGIAAAVAAGRGLAPAAGLGDTPG